MIDATQWGRWITSISGLIVLGFGLATFSPATQYESTALILSGIALFFLNFPHFSFLTNISGAALIIFTALTQQLALNLKEFSIQSAIQSHNLIQIAFFLIGTIFLIWPKRALTWTHRIYYLPAFFFILFFSLLTIVTSVINNSENISYKYSIALSLVTITILIDIICKEIEITWRTWSSVIVGATLFVSSTVFIVTLTAIYNLYPNTEQTDKLLKILIGYAFWGGIVLAILGGYLVNLLTYLRREIHFLRLFESTTKILQGSHSLQEMAEKLFALFRDRLGWQLMHIEHCPSPTEEYESIFLQASSDFSPQFIAATKEIKHLQDKDFYQYATETRSPLASRDFGEEKHLRSAIAKQENVKGALIFPILEGSRVIGIVECFRKTPYLTRVEPLLSSLLFTIGIAIGDFLQNIAIKTLEQRHGELIGTVSHELRTPLTSIHGALGLLVEEPGLSEKVHELLFLAFRNSTILSHLIRDLVDVEKMSAGKTEYHWEVVELAPLIRETVRSIALLSSPRNITFEEEGMLEKILVKVDPFRLTQVFNNLLSNAVHASPSGKKITISMQRSENRIFVAVRDEGSGISSEFQQKLFGRFEQTDKDTRSPGKSGLGLYISKEIVMRLNGTISYESSPGLGSIFTVSLPIYTGGSP
ncbi:MAG: HAMP domain-containing histidine kinase [Verrucomicrobiota bacterium]|nr:HAMP domain-containing histidine kinase [Verrucomicrobiota bacterium]